MKITPIIRSLNLVLICLTTLVLPLFFLPLTTEYYNLNKTFLFFILVSIMILGWLIEVVSSKQMVVKKQSLAWPLMLLFLVFLASTIWRSPNKMASLTGPTSQILMLGFWYFLVANFVTDKKALGWIFGCLITSSTFLAGLSIVNISTTGSLITTLQLILIVLPITWWQVKKTKPVWLKIVLIVCGLTQFISVILAGKTIILTPHLPYKIGWQISLEGMKKWPTALLGVGPGNFIVEFQQLRPLSFNKTGLWQTKFINNSNQYWEILSTVGLLGLLVYAWFFVQAIKKADQNSLKLSLLTALVIQLFWPINLVVLVWIVLLAGLSMKNKEFTLDSGLLIWLGTLVLGLLVLWSLNWQIRLWQADQYFKKSLMAAQNNKGGETYEWQVKALKKNPYEENYRVAFSNTNLALAFSLARKENFSDPDREKVVKLVGQAVNEAKAAISLNPLDSRYWLNLAVIYRSLINTTADADKWAIAGFEQAISLDPINPLLRWELGGVYFGLKNYKQAVKLFGQSVELKPDFANGYYNLAAGYKEMKNWELAGQNLSQALSLVNPDNPEYEKAKKELEEIKAKLTAPVQEVKSGLSSQEKLSTPSPLPSSDARVGQIKLLEP